MIGDIGRGVGGGIVNAGSLGVFEIAVDLTTMPQGSGFVSVMPGDTWRFEPGTETSTEARSPRTSRTGWP